MEEIVGKAITNSYHKRLAYLEGMEIITLAEYAKRAKIYHSNLINKAQCQTIEAFYVSQCLKQRLAVKISISIIKAFVKLRQILFTHKELAGKVSELERKVEKYGIEIKAVFDAIRQLMIEEKKPKPLIGFRKQ